MSAKYLYAVELDISHEAGCQGFRVPRAGYWLIHDETEETHSLCVYETYKEAREATKGRDHQARIVRFKRDSVRPS